MASDDTKPEIQADSPLNPFAFHKLAGEQPASVKDLRQLAFLYMQDGVSVVDKNGLQVDVNPAFCAMTGFSEEELIGYGPGDCYWPPEEREKIQIAFDKTLHGEFSEVQLIFMRKDGERFPVLVVPFAIRDASGRITFLAATVKDLTQRVKIEDALRNSEVRYQKLFHSAGDGIVIMEGDKAVDCNERILELYGVSRDQLMGLVSFSLSPPTQPNGKMSSEFFFEKVVAADSGNPQIFEWLGKKIDGTPVETEITLTTFTLGSKHYTQSIVRDISKRKLLEDALRNSEVRFRTLFESAGDAIVIMKGNQIIDVNQRNEELFGYSRDKILSTPATGFFPPTQPNGQDSNEFFSEMIEASRSGDPQFFEWTGRNIDGTPIHTEVTLTTFTLDEEYYTQSIVRDITHRKKMEKALVDLNKTLEDRVAQRTGDLEKAYAELLQRNFQFRELTKRLTQAEEQERKRIARLLHDNHQQLLVAAKFRLEMLQSNSDDTETNSAAQNVLEILDQAVDITRSLTMELAPPILSGSGLVVAMQWLARWMEEQHRLEVVVLGSLPSIRISTDASDLLFRAVRELLFNVVKHSGVRQARVTIELVDQLLLLTVEDEGAGFDAAGTLNLPGSYGLFSIQEQLSSLDGRLDISSTPQRGTVCSLSVPMAAADLSNLEVSPAVDAITTEITDTLQPLGGPIRILVADDHMVARQALANILSMAEDFDVVGEAIDGLDAVEKTRALMPDVILMDVSMPRMNGLEATRSIKNEFSAVKVIGLSMHSSEEMESQMLAAGATSYLQKLTAVDALFATIRGVMDRAPTS